MYTGIQEAPATKNIRNYLYKPGFTTIVVPLPAKLLRLLWHSRKACFSQIHTGSTSFVYYAGFCIKTILL
jgi:hypothetical protein